MCGIAGFFNTFDDVENHQQKIAKMITMIAHRGPDELAYGVDAQTAMATARLSVIDLKHGQQPMRDKSGQFWICYNGEIYNYLELRKELIELGVSFETASDTEVVLQAYLSWGVEAFERFNGGYAFCIYDSHEKKLLLARDRFGKRPLYYLRYKKGIIFASEIKCFHPLDEVNLEFDYENISDSFSFWTLLPEQSPFTGIGQIVPGGYLEVNLSGDTNYQKYYKLPQLQDSISDLQSAKREVKKSLEESVKIRLRSDVTVGSYLSGGLDSAITSHLAAKYSNHQLNTFSIEFENSQYDESKAQSALVETLQSKHHAIRIKDEDIVRNFSEALQFAEVPVFRSAFVPMYLLSSKVRQSGIKVVLTGEGADEIFLGYNIFKETIIRENWQQLSSADQKNQAVAKLYPYLNHFKQNTQKLSALFDSASTHSENMLFSHQLRFLNGKFSRRLLKTPTQNSEERITTLMNKNLHPQSSSLTKAQWLEFYTLLHGYLLSTQGDRMSFAHGIETRQPFLDYKLVALANRLSVELKLTNQFEEKHILKKLFAKELPHKILNQHKQPFRAPDASAFFNHKDAEWADLVNDKNLLKDIGFLNQSFIEKFVAKLMAARAQNISPRESQTFLMLLSLLYLHKQFILKHNNWKQANIIAECRFDLRA